MVFWMTEPLKQTIIIMSFVFLLGVLLEQHLLLNRRNKITDDYQVKHRELVNNSCVYICTTMYHEIEQEMEQLLHSLQTLTVHGRNQNVK